MYQNDCTTSTENKKIPEFLFILLHFSWNTKCGLRDVL